MLSPTTTHLTGTVYPTAETPCSPERLLGILRDRGVLAAVGREELDALSRAAGIDESRLPLKVSLAANEDDQVLTLTTDGARPGPSAAEVAAHIAAATGCETDIMGEWHPGQHPPSPEDEQAPGPVWLDTDTAPAPPSVLLCRMTSDMLPMLARDLGCSIEAAKVDGWTLIRLTEGDADLSNHGWLTHESPVVTLSSIDGRPYLDVLVGWGTLPGHPLTRQPSVRPTYTTDEVDATVRPIIEALSDLNLAPGSPLRRLLEEAPFAAVAPEVLLAAVQSPDAGWHARVLAALGLPTFAADVFDGAPLPSAERVEPLGFVGAVRAALGRYERATPDDVAKRGPLGRLYGAAAQRPLLALVTIVPEVLVGVPVLAWVVGAEDRPWWLLAFGGVAALLLLDAVADLALMVRRLRRPRH